jgi:hypothetical protein
MSPNGGSQEEQQQQAVPAEVATRPAPIMDVVAPRNDVVPAPVIEAPQEEDSNVVAATPAPDVSPDKLIQEEIERENSIDTPARPVNTQKHAGNGVMPAIIATVIIVFGLAALAVFAYMQTKKT